MQLKEIGVTRHESSEAQHLVKFPEETFQAVKGFAITRTEAARQARRKRCPEGLVIPGLAAFRLKGGVGLVRPPVGPPPYTPYSVFPRRSRLGKNEKKEKRDLTKFVPSLSGDNVILKKGAIA